MKKKDSIAKAENELLSFQQQLNENLAKNEESSSTSLPELFSETDKKVQPEKSNDNNNNNTSTEKKQLYENELLKILDSEEIKNRTDSINKLNIGNKKIFNSYFKYIYYDIPSCPDFIENLNIQHSYDYDDGSESSSNNNLCDYNYNSDTNNIKNCIFSLYKWNYLFLKIMKFIEERENYTKKVADQYKSQVEHIELLKDVINQRSINESTQSIIHKFIQEKQKMKNEMRRKSIIGTEDKNIELYNEINYIERKETETQTKYVKYAEKSVETQRVQNIKKNNNNNKKMKKIKK
ncbi:hypothetical protein H8356DRAFT_1269565 [Neocallimastix lanati (nom. inval.)]|nr:hypothetical protein H8356DRAFT_1269565 [Neocallimastix sp. JGI-2020a]